MSRVFVAASLLVIAVSSVSLAGDVTQFRGSSGDGISLGTLAPAEFSESENFVWKAEIPGKGWSSPVIADGKIWVTTAVEVFPDEAEREELLTKAGDDPKTFSQRQIAKSLTLKLVQLNAASGEIEEILSLIQVDQPDPIHKLNSYASPTPTIDGDRIYCHFGTYGTLCLSRDDLSTIWHKTIPLVHSVGPGSSPYVHDNLLVLICDGVDAQFVTALDKMTGEELWKTDRPPMEAPDGDRKKAYVTPISAIDENGREQLICMGSQWLVSYDPENGDELWKVYHGKGFSVVPRPVLGDGVVYVSTGFGKAQLWAVRIDGAGDVTDTHVNWTEKRNIPNKPSPLLLGDRLYLMDDTGVASCLNAVNGSTLWRERVGGNYSASPLFADGKIFYASHEGKVTVIEPADEFQKLAENSLPGQIMASPIAVDDSLYLRTDTAIYRFEKK